MKRIILFAVLFFGILLVAPVWSHHAAEGIISDDVWQMINDQLLEIDSPHLNIDFDDVMASMGSAEEGGKVFLTTTITVMEEDAGLYVDLIEDAVAQALADAVADQTAPDGIVGNGNSKTFDVEIVPRDDDSGYVDIFLYEMLGKGNSQAAPDDPDAPVTEPPGKRPRGG